MRCSQQIQMKQISTWHNGAGWCAPSISNLRMKEGSSSGGGSVLYSALELKTTSACQSSASRKFLRLVRLHGFSREHASPLKEHKSRSELWYLGFWVEGNGPPQDRDRSVCLLFCPQGEFLTGRVLALLQAQLQEYGDHQDNDGSWWGTSMQICASGMPGHVL